MPMAGTSRRRRWRWLRSMFPGADRQRPIALLDNAPLATLLARTIHFPSIEQSINAGALDALTITASSYRTGMSVSFCMGGPGLELWERSQRIGVRADIGSFALARVERDSIRVPADQDRQRVLRRRRDEPDGADRAGAPSRRGSHPGGRRCPYQHARPRDPEPALAGADRQPGVCERLYRRAGHRPGEGPAGEYRRASDSAGAASRRVRCRCATSCCW